MSCCRWPSTQCHDTPFTMNSSHTAVLYALYLHPRAFSFLARWLIFLPFLALEGKDQISQLMHIHIHARKKSSPEKNKAGKKHDILPTEKKRRLVPDISNPHQCVVNSRCARPLAACIYSTEKSQDMIRCLSYLPTSVECMHAWMW